MPPGPVTVPENNTAEVQVVKITSGSDVVLTVVVNPEDLFYLKGRALMAKKGLDYEVRKGSNQKQTCGSHKLSLLKTAQGGEMFDVDP